MERYFIFPLNTLSIKIKFLKVVERKATLKISMRLIAFLLLLGGGIIALAYVPQQKDFYQIIIFYSIAFIGYLGIIKWCKNDLSIAQWLVIATLLRLCLLFSFPNLSDDIYRFIWDGNLIHQFHNPYSLLPSEVVGVAGNTPELFGLLNSPEYYTVYPPVSQVIYWISSWGDISYTSSALIIKLCILGAEIGSFFFFILILRLIDLQAHRFLLYALNPLILIEVMGNVHFEGIMLFFLLASIYYAIQKKTILSGVFLALGTATKLLPLLFFPFIWTFSGYSKRLFFSFGVGCIVLFSPLLLGVEFSNFATSIDLYFGKFEFNGGIYYLLRYVGNLLSGYNLIRYIGPLMAIITIGLIIKLWKVQQHYNTSQLLLYSFMSISSYYLLSTTVHPWYLCLPLALSLFTPYRFIILWTGLIMLSYIHYSYDPYRENLWVAFLEYGLVLGYLLYECKTKKAIPN